VDVSRRYGIRGRTASELAASVETAIRDGTLRPGAVLPTVRATAAALELSPTTVAAAYRELRARGLVQGRSRLGTRVTDRPPLPVVSAAPVPAHLRNRAHGNPDPALLPRMESVFSRLDLRTRLYGEPANRDDLLALAARSFAEDGIPAGPIAVVGGALDGIERVVQARLRPGDRIAVEDPGYVAVLDLVGALGLVPEPIAVDDAGPIPEELGRALGAGVAAVLVTPRAQNPTGAALDAERARALRATLALHPDVLLIEDDHAGTVAGAAPITLAAGRSRWSVVRSVSKTLGPDLRLAILTGDETTIARVEGRQLVGAGWVSHVLQGMVAELWKRADTERRLRRAAEHYRTRRERLIGALAARGIEAHGRSGFNVWIPVPEEAAAVTALAEAGIAVRSGERYRLKSPSAVRYTISALEPGEEHVAAEALAQALRPGRRTASA
jgi:DNA-binding transcriptional MocR family regulator